MAYEFATATVGSLKANVALNENGNIAQDGDSVAANKMFTIHGVKADANFEQANKLYNALIGGIAKGSYDSTTMLRTVTVGVVEKGE